MESGQILPGVIGKQPSVWRTCYYFCGCDNLAKSNWYLFIVVVYAIFGFAMIYPHMLYFDLKICEKDKNCDYVWDFILAIFMFGTMYVTSGLIIIEYYIEKQKLKATDDFEEPRTWLLISSSLYASGFAIQYIYPGTAWWIGFCIGLGIICLIFAVGCGINKWKMAVETERKLCVDKA
ncbi:MAG: hypothetical protein Edafosvirus1_36 [Edafosvirus sp.]|uniref:Uncharacterized protein n=1 Tax=Edafosvirus sp. TaxID=2487765 RepID=A0A3G4ZS54_9VIRU|nr:MAG: hypothetical protein Edafosvirus1_36 [Edafosvirus sp.]